MIAQLFGAASDPAVLPLWVQWIVAVSTAVLDAAVAAIAVGTMRLTARAEAAAAQSKDLANWQRYDQELASFRDVLEQRVGHAYLTRGLEELGAPITQFPRSPSEPIEQRVVRRRQPATTEGSDAEKNYESPLFTQQADGGWKLEMQWSSYRHVEDAFIHVAIKQQLPVDRPRTVSGATSVWAAGPTFLLVTRPAGSGAPI